MTLMERARARTPVSWLTVTGLLLLPVVIGGVLIAALHNPTERLENMTAAIVNADEPVTVDGQYTPLGRQLAAGLVEGAGGEDRTPDAEAPGDAKAPSGGASGDNLTWVLSNDEDAADGLEDGTYQAVVTIPENFSAAAMSPAQRLQGGDERPEQAMIDVTTAPDALVLDQAITDQLANVATDTMGNTLSEGMMSNLLVGFGSMGDELGQAADGAQRLADGTHDAADGATQLGDGATQVADGVEQLGEGIGQLADGAGSASTGAQDLAAGAHELADGVPALTDGASGLADGASGLADGIAQLENGVSGNGGLVDGARQLADGLSAGVEGVRNAKLVPEELDQAASGAAQASAGVADHLASLADACTSETSPSYCAEIGEQLSELSEAAGDSARASSGVEQGIDGLAAHAPAQLADGLAPLVDGADALASGTTTISESLPQLSDGAHQLADGAARLADGAARFGDGASALADGTSGLADGVGQLATGAGQAAANTPRLQDGATQVADGVVELGDGVGELGDGAGDLADGLDRAVDSVPSFSEREAEDLAGVVADPVTTSSGSGMFGAASIPLLAVAVLWFGALATFFALRAVSWKALTSRRPSVLLAGGSLLPAATIGAVQGALVAVTVELAAGDDSGSFWGLFGLSILTGVAFAAVHQALIAVFGGTGRWIAGIVGAFAVAIGIISTMPAALLGVRPLLPTSPAFDGMLSVITGSPGAAAAATGLIVWAALAFIATTIAVTMRRSVGAKALLKPSLA